MFIMHLLKRMYNWVLYWAQTPYGVPALFLLAFAESSFFPIPPDVLLIALSLSIPKNAFKYALVCSAGSVLGGTFGYLLGWQFWEVAQGILFRYVDQTGFESVRHYFLEYEAWAVGIAGFTPIPYKVFTLAAGFMRTNFSVFIVASLISRSARFLLVATLIYFFGPPIREFIEKYFEVATLAFSALLVGGILLLMAIL